MMRYNYRIDCIEGNFVDFDSDGLLAFDLDPKYITIQANNGTVVLNTAHIIKIMITDRENPNQMNNPSPMTP